MENLNLNPVSLEEKKEPTAICDIIEAFRENNEDVRVLREFAILKNIIRKEECEKIIKSVEKMGMKPLVTSYPLRRTKRIIIDSKELAEVVWGRVKNYIPFKEVRDEFGDIWHLTGINERFRFCSYGNGDNFKAHCDGYWQPSYRKRSFATFMIYLNDVDDNMGGSTRFLDYGLYMRPRAGNGILFLTDDLLHDGEVLTNTDNDMAVKYIMRTDIMYECKKFRHSDMRKKIYDMRELAYRYQDEGREGEAIKVWENIINLEAELKNINNKKLVTPKESTEITSVEISESIVNNIIDNVIDEIEKSN
jgi:hypothetical protein